MPLHVSSKFAHHQEVKITLYSLWFHHTYRWPSRAQVCTIVQGNFQRIYPEITETAGHNKHWSGPALKRQCLVCCARSGMRYMRSMSSVTLYFAWSETFRGLPHKWRLLERRFLHYPYKQLELQQNISKRQWIFTKFLKTYLLHYTVRLYKAF